MVVLDDPNERWSAIEALSRSVSGRSVSVAENAEEAEPAEEVRSRSQEELVRRMEMDGPRAQSFLFSPSDLDQWKAEAMMSEEDQLDPESTRSSHEVE
jgi:hypothetical protein